MIPAAQPSLFEAPRGFWLMPHDARRTLGEVAAAGDTLRLTCAACRRTRYVGPDRLTALGPPDTSMAALARRAVCADPACGARRCVLSVLSPPDGPRRAGHVTERDLARIRALAEQVTETHSPPVLDDLDCPLRVGAFMPGAEAYEGGTVVGAWAGRVLVGWRITQAAKNTRRKAGR
jgi:hypothetical protein